MALGDSYATLAELKAELGISDAIDDAKLTLALSVASDLIETDTGRQFNLDTGLTTRTYYPESPSLMLFDDISTVTGLVLKTDQDDDGTFETIWVAADYQLEPINGTMFGMTGQPYRRARAVGTKYFPVKGGHTEGDSIWQEYLNSSRLQAHRRPSAQVTATFGWTAVPSNIKQACLLLGAEMLKLKDAAFGVADFGQYGAIRVKENPAIAKLLHKYKRSGGRNSLTFA